MTPSTVTKLARTLESCLVDPGVPELTGDLPRDGGEVMGLSPFSNLASRLRTPGWALLSAMVREQSQARFRRSGVDWEDRKASNAQGREVRLGRGQVVNIESHWTPQRNK